MKVNYVTDHFGHTIAVQIPIEDWHLLQKQLPDMEAIQEDLPQWQRDMLDKRLKEIANNPERLRPIEELYEELDAAD